MTDPVPPRPSSSDQGTELGRGTRLLTTAFTLPIRSFRALGRGCGRVFAAVNRWTEALAPTFARIARAIWRISKPVLIVLVCLTVGPAWLAWNIAATGVLAWLALFIGVLVVVPIAVVSGLAWLIVRGAQVAWPSVRGLATPFRRAGRWAIHLIAAAGRQIGPVFAAAFQRIGRAIAVGAHAVAHAVTTIAGPIGHVLTTIGHVLTTIGHAIAAGGRAIGHAIGVAARAVGHAITAVARPIGHAIAAGGHAIGHAIAMAARATGRAVHTVARPIGFAIATAGHAIGNAIAMAARATGRAVHTVARPIGFAIATAGHAIGIAFAVAARATGYAITAVARTIGLAIATGGHAIGHVIAAIAQPITRFARQIEEAIARRGRRVAHSTGVAMARARHSVSPSPAPATHLAATALVPAPILDAPFAVDLFHNEYLTRNGRQVDAIISVSALAPTSDDAHVAAPSAVVILVDCSGSMGHPWRKLRGARAATKAAIQSLPDGTWFAVVRATHDAEVVYPEHSGLVPKSAETQAAAERALSLLWPEGGTAMGRWLLLARQLFDSHPEAIPHAILLTDGRNESESPEAFRAALRSCEGRFQCDCRGIGTDWEVRELQAIATSTLGTVDIVADTNDLAADFRSMAEAATAKRVDRVALRVWTASTASVRFVRQVAPHISELTDLPRRIDAHTVEYPTGSWTTETRDYHLCVDMPTKPVGSEMLAARVSLVVGERVVSKLLVTAIWTDDMELATRVVPEVEYATGQTDLLHLIRAGLDARREGDDERATEQLGLAAQLALQTGNAATLQLIGNVVDIDDAATGTVRTKATLDEADAMALEARSTRTTRITQPADELATAS